MKLRHLFPELERRNGEIVAAFGNARLVKRLDCRFELRGGSEQDRADAREWISLFLHEAVIVPPIARHRPMTTVNDRSRDQ